MKNVWQRVDMDNITSFHTNFQLFRSYVTIKHVDRIKNKKTKRMVQKGHQYLSPCQYKIVLKIKHAPRAGGHIIIQEPFT